MNHLKEQTTYDNMQNDGRLTSYTQQLHSLSVNHSPNPNPNSNLFFVL